MTKTPKVLKTPEATLASVMEHIVAENVAAKAAGAHVKLYAEMGAGQGDVVEFCKPETASNFLRSWELQQATYVDRVGGKSTPEGEALNAKLNTYKRRTLDYVYAALIAKNYTQADIAEPAAKIAKSARAKALAASVATGGNTKERRSPDEIARDLAKALYSYLLKASEKDGDGKYPRIEAAMGPTRAVLKAFGVNPDNVE